MHLFGYAFGVDVGWVRTCEIKDDHWVQKILNSKKLNVQNFYVVRTSDHLPNFTGSYKKRVWLRVSLFYGCVFVLWVCGCFMGVTLSVCVLVCVCVCVCVCLLVCVSVCVYLCGCGSGMTPTMLSPFNIWRVITGPSVHIINYSFKKVL